MVGDGEQDKAALGFVEDRFQEVEGIPGKVVGLVDDDQAWRQGKSLDDGAFGVSCTPPVPADAQASGKLAEGVHVRLGPGRGGVDDLAGVFGGDVAGRVGLAAARGSYDQHQPVLVLCDPCGGNSIRGHLDMIQQHDAAVHNGHLIGGGDVRIQSGLHGSQRIVAVAGVGAFLDLSPGGRGEGEFDAAAEVGVIESGCGLVGGQGQHVRVL